MEAEFKVFEAQIRLEFSVQTPRIQPSFLNSMGERPVMRRKAVEK